MNNQSNQNQKKQLISFLEKNPDIFHILNICQSWKLPNWYLGAGGIVQTVWNISHGFNPTYGIKDYDLVYFDNTDLSYEAEDKIIKQGEQLFKEIFIPVEIRNQARVHLWYQKHFGGKIDPIISSENAIAGWPTTATATGINLIDNNINVYAPFGLDDLLNLVVRPNKKQITKKIYEDKINRWQKIWPKLKIISWEESE